MMLLQDYISAQFKTSIEAYLQPWLDFHEKEIMTLEPQAEAFEETGLEITDVKLKDSFLSTIQVYVFLKTDIEYISFDDFVGTCIAKHPLELMIQASMDVEAGIDKMILGEIIPITFGAEIPDLPETYLSCISREDLDVCAQYTLEKYYPELTDNNEAVDPLALAARLGLRIFPIITYDDPGFCAKVFFKDSKEPYDVKNRELDLPKLFPKRGDIYLADYRSRSKAWRFDIAHEISHWILHSKTFLLIDQLNEKKISLDCILPKKLQDDCADWFEWQADTLAARLLMPEVLFKTKADEFLELFYPLELGPRYEYTIKSLADFFQVSVLSAKIRMVECGYSRAEGVLEFCDGCYVPAHFEVACRIPGIHTYTISQKQLQDFRRKEPQIRNYLDSGEYVFVENHICKNDPKFITRRKGKLELTPYARISMSLCCIPFYRQHCILDSVPLSQLDTDCVDRKDFSRLYLAFRNGETVNPADVLEYKEEISSLIDALPGSFSLALTKVIEWDGSTIEEISAASDIDVSTINNYRKKPECKKTLEAVVAICIGMKLDSSISEKLIERAGFHLLDSAEQGMYKMFLRFPHEISIHECNEMLQLCGYKPLTGRRKKKASSLLSLQPA